MHVKKTEVHDQVVKLKKKKNVALLIKSNATHLKCELIIINVTIITVSVD